MDTDKLIRQLEDSHTVLDNLKTILSWADSNCGKSVSFDFKSKALADIAGKADEAIEAATNLVKELMSK